MDYFGLDRRSLRGDALIKLAKLHAANSSVRLVPPGSNGNGSFKTLVGLNNAPTKNLSILATRDYENLLALCSSVGELMTSKELAKLILDRLTVYFLKLPEVKISHHVSARYFQSPPWLNLSEKITFALTKLAGQFDGEFRLQVVDVFEKFLDLFSKNSDKFDTNYYAFLGLLKGLQDNAEFLILTPDTFKVYNRVYSEIDDLKFQDLVDDHDFQRYGHEKLLNSLDFQMESAKLTHAVTRSLAHIEGDELLEVIVARHSGTDKKSNGMANGKLINKPNMSSVVVKNAMHRLSSLEEIEEDLVSLHGAEDQLKLKQINITRLYCIEIIGYGVDTSIISLQEATQIFNRYVDEPTAMIDPLLGLSIFQLGSYLVQEDNSLWIPLGKAFTSLVVNPLFSYIDGASKSVGLSTKLLSQDSVITMIYSLTNLVIINSDAAATLTGRTTQRNLSGLRRLDSMSIKEDHTGLGGTRISLARSIRTHRTFITSRTSNSHRSGEFGGHKLESYTEEEYQKVCANAIKGILEICKYCGDESVITLAVTILTQKATRLETPTGKLLLDGLVACSPYLPKKEFVIIFKFLDRLTLDALASRNTALVDRFVASSMQLATILQPSNPLYYTFLEELLSVIVSQGDVEEFEHHRSHNEISEVAQKIGLYLRPLAVLLPDFNKGEPPLKIKELTLINLFRNIWFNMTVHGFSAKLSIAHPYLHDLERIAYNSPPLASELLWNRTETSFDLNTVLRRGSSNHNVKHQRDTLGKVFEVHRSISYPKLMFLGATLFVEMIRIRSGNCSTILYYFSDMSVHTSGVEKYIHPITIEVVKEYVRFVDHGPSRHFNSAKTSEQITTMLQLCCNRIPDMQEAALKCSNYLIEHVPSCLCHRGSLYAVFDILTLLYDGVVDFDRNQYVPTTEFIAGSVKLLLPDLYDWRTETLKTFHAQATKWVQLLLVRCNVDVMSLISLYVAHASQREVPDVSFGTSFALQMLGSFVPGAHSSLPRLGFQEVNTLPQLVSRLGFRNKFFSDLLNTVNLEYGDTVFERIKGNVAEFEVGDYADDQTSDLINELAGLALIADVNTGALIRYLVNIPFRLFELDIMEAAITIWFAIMKDRRGTSLLLISEVARHWEITIKERLGLYSDQFDITEVEYCYMEYSPSSRGTFANPAALADKLFLPHLQMIRLFSLHFQASMNQLTHLLKLFTRFVEIGLLNLKVASLHPYACVPRFELINFAFDVMNYHLKIGSGNAERLCELLLDGALTWFHRRPVYPFGSNVLKMKETLHLLKNIAHQIKTLSSFKSSSIATSKSMLTIFLDDEITRISLWLSPLTPQYSKLQALSVDQSLLHRAYARDPILAINLVARCNPRHGDSILQHLIAKNPVPAMPYAEAIPYYLGLDSNPKMPLHHLLFWASLGPVDCINLFLPAFEKSQFVLQYTMRSLKLHDVRLVFFYVPQLVQCLRFDKHRVVEKFIVETSKVSQLFAHQMIWNMLANSYKDEDLTEPDPLKPTLDSIQEEMTGAFSKAELGFYQKEFGFFNEVTDISGKLKPYIKKTKAEKKTKIDEEMAKIEVLDGVYLPSNPDGVVIDIARKSGKPLQSHAKAPFMATFKIKKEIDDYDLRGRAIKSEIEKWQAAIFKVGDDCRQDVLILQIVAVFRTIWANAGLDLYVYPYRVTATAPGCGVIDVLPNSTSRDMLGREAVNGLYEYFTTKFGPPSSLEFQEARNNFIKSLAGYSIITYLMQIKDRHNGNIMYDDQGHVLHIDFGFCFDIVPGGVKFEAAPFKLTHEMVMVLGGSSSTQAFKWYEELCVKGFLACRPYMDLIVRCVEPMLELGLPCFKPQTMKKLKSRFVPEKNDRDASNYMRGLIKKSTESVYTSIYDEFQKITNGIPY